MIKKYNSLFGHADIKTQIAWHQKEDIPKAVFLTAESRLLKWATKKPMKNLKF